MRKETETLKDNFKIISVSPGLIQVEVLDAEKVREQIKTFSIGSYLKISDHSGNAIISIIHSYRIKEMNSQKEDEEYSDPSFILDTEPVGYLDSSGRFTRGGQHIAIPPSEVEIASADILKSIYTSVDKEKQFIFSDLAQDNSIEIPVDGDLFFSKHLAVVGSTGSGKSGTVARILQEAVRGSDDQDKRSILNNSHILIFDLHGEYKTAFPAANFLSVETLKLPYWLMNSEELEEIFIESNEQNSHNQISQFRHAVIENKKANNPSISDISYDAPLYFSLNEVINYITNLNKEMLGKAPDENGEPKLRDGTIVHRREDHYFQTIQEFVPYSTKQAEKATGGPFHGDFERFLMRLNAKLNDDRLKFLLDPKNSKGQPFTTTDLSGLLKQFVGYSRKESNVTILDLSGIPFEVLSVVVSLVSRLVFDMCFEFKKLKMPGEEVPFLIVLEEAHNYIPRSQGAKYNSVKKSIERIAKEGRKYGLSLMIVSQRPSEISPTIFSQCNNFISMRLTNPIDQQYIKKLMPDHISSITDSLPVLNRQEAILIGDAIAIPTIVRIKDLEKKPSSEDIDFHTEWKEDWFKRLFEKLHPENDPT